MKLRGKAVVAALCALAWVAPQARAETGRHCSFRLVPLEPVGVGTDAAVELIGCFGTYEAAIESGLGGGVDLDSSVSPQSLSDDVLAAENIAASSVLIGTEYLGLNFNGVSNNYFASSTCSSGVSWSVSYVGDAWNDAFSSGKGFGGCDENRKFQHSSFGGAVKVCTPNCADYGSLSNQVSSLRWRP